MFSALLSDAYTRVVTGLKRAVMSLARRRSSHEARSGVTHRLPDPVTELERRLVTERRVALEIHINKKFKIFRLLFNDVEFLA